MKRRDAIKNIGLAAGFAIVAPSFLSILQSCKSETDTWSSLILKDDEKQALTRLVDIIIPKTDTTPSASEVNVPQFIDKYMAEVLEPKDLEVSQKAFRDFIALLTKNNTIAIDDLEDKDYTTILDKYLLVKGEVDSEREVNPKSLELTKSEFLDQIKWLTIKAYRGSEMIGENVLVYEPVPSENYCGDLQKLTNGKSYSL